MMKHLRKPLLKSFAVFMALNIILNTFLPTVVMALTSGPSTPEYSSFEPVDTTDMVNLVSGDFTYNMPLLEVPGPEGGYPLSLSYHAGIRPEQEASWVGLGWTLNAGAINRNVNGYADDVADAKRNVTDYWAGGSVKENTYGFTYGLALGAAGSTGITANSITRQDTYSGFSVGSDLSVGLNVNTGHATASLGIGSNSFSGDYSSFGVGASAGGASALKASASASYSSNSNTWGFMASASFNTQGRNLTSISSSGKVGLGSTSVSINQVNANQGRIRTSSSGSNFSVPIPKVPGLFINLGKRYTRYWSYEESNVGSYGILHANLTQDKSSENYSLDSYPLMDPEVDILENPNADKVLGGSFPAVDNYTVLAQGLGGQIKPYIFENASLFRQDIRPSNGLGSLEYKKYNSFTKKINFRFLGDFSNRLEKKQSNIEFETSQVPFNINELLEVDNNGFNDVDNHLAGSKHIEWFTNEEVANGIATDSYGFIPYDQQADGEQGRSTTYMLDALNGGQVYPFDISKQVGGFMITNESGVTYHYSLPVYNCMEYMVRDNAHDAEEGYAYRSENNIQPYAYTWLLTGITGPDYIDRGEKGMDEEDWGYWVKFEYGKWTDQFMWRNPGVGFTQDIEGKAQYVSVGRKEIYYLDAIKTRSHTALFVKSVRKDGKGMYMSPRVYSGVNSFQDPDYRIGDYLDDDPYGYIHKFQKTGCLQQKHINPHVSASQLKLDQIILVENNRLQDLITEKGGDVLPAKGGIKAISYDEYPSTSNCYSSSSKKEYKVHYYENVLESTDFDANLSLNSLLEVSVNAISFDSDYSLCPETPNSFDIDYSMDLGYPTDYYASSRVNQMVDVVNSGKLTLKAINTLGRGGASLIPPTSFDYGSDFESILGNYPIYAKQAVVDSEPEGKNEIEIHNIQGASIGLGDLLRLSVEDDSNSGGARINYYVNVIELVGTKAIALVVGKNKIYGSGNVFDAKIKRTNNPPYNANAYDKWGYYKSDYTNASEESLSRLVTDISAKNIDAWSLSRISTPIGSDIEIEYESDDYTTPAFYFGYPLKATGLTPVENSTELLDLTLERSFDRLEKLLVPGQILEGFVFTSRPFSSVPSYDRLTNQVMYGFIPKIYEGQIEVTDVVTLDNKEITVRVKSRELYEMNRPIDNTYPFDLRESFFTENPMIPRIPDVGTLYSQYSLKSTGTRFHAGALNLVGQNRILGGGCRVKQINTINSSSKIIRSTHYSYGLKSESYGVTAYEPNTLRRVEYTYPDSWEGEGASAYAMYLHYNYGASGNGYLGEGTIPVVEKFLNTAYQEGFNNLIHLSQELPSPGVLYSKVVVTESVKNNLEDRVLPGRKVYQFQTFEEPMIERKLDENIEGQEKVNVDGKQYNAFKRKITIRNKMANLGALLSVSSYDINDNLIERRTNHYLGGFLSYEDYARKFNNQGVIEQSFNETRIYNNGNQWQGMLSVKEEYPGVMLGTTVENFKAGIKSSTFNQAFDFYTGQPTEILYTDSYGNEYLQYTKLAYTVYPEMGLKVHDPAHKHMLSQQAGNYLFKGKEIDFDKVLDAGVQTWEKNSEGQYHKHSSFIWNSPVSGSDGTFAGFVYFDFSQGAQYASQWQKTGEITLYDTYSHPLEAMDINGNYSSTKMDSEFKKILAGVSNAGYHESAYSGAEDILINDAFGGGIRKNAGIQNLNLDFVHTGTRSLKTVGKGFSYTVPKDEISRPKRWYRANVWVKSQDGSVPTTASLHIQQGSKMISMVGTDVKVKKRANTDWYQLNIQIELDDTAPIEIYCENTGSIPVYFDDFRFQPIDATMISYAYNQWGELSHVMDNNNLFTKYEYDEMGRLVAIYQESFQYGVKKVSDHEVHYRKQ